MPNDEMILSDYLGVINRRKIFICAVIACGLAATFLLTSHEPATYRSRTRIKVQRQINVTQMFDELLVSSGDPLENYIMEISGYDVVSNAAARLSMPDKPSNADIASLRGSISVERIARTDLLDIYTTGTSPEESRGRGDAITSAFIDQHDISIRKNAQEILQTIKDSYSNLSHNLKQREAELLEKLGPYAVTAAKDSELSPLRQRLADLQVQLQRLRLSGNFTEEYPEIIRLRAEIEQIENLIQKQVIAEIERQAQLAEYERYKAIIQKTDTFFTPRIEEAKIAASKKNEIIHIIEPTSEGRKVGTGQKHKIIAGGLLSLMLAVVLAFIADHLDTSVRNIPEIERVFKLSVLGIIPHFSPREDSSPIKRNRALQRLRRLAPVTSAEILLSAFKTAFGRATPHHHDPAETSPIPNNLIVPLAPRAPATESYRTLRTNIQLHLQPDNNAIVFTSANPEEGKSTTITNLAVAFAQGGKRVLLVGANMRRPQMHRIFGLSREPGLSDILVGDVKWRETVKDYSDVALGEGGQSLATAPGMDNLQFITCGGRTIHPAEWLSQPILADLIKEWKAAYDIVLIDSPPVLPVPDSVVLSMTVRQTILVYQVGVTPRESVRRAINAIQNTEAFLAGIVLNDLHSSRVDDTDFYQYRHYYGRQD